MLDGFHHIFMVSGLVVRSYDMKHWIRTSTSFLSEEPVVYIHREDGAQFPENEGNPDYQQYLAWVALGNVAEEWTGN